MSEETKSEPTNDTEIVTEGLVRHNQKLLDELKAERAKVAQYEADKAERETAAAKKAGDYETLLKKEQERAAKALAERDAGLSARDAKINQLLTDNALASIMSKVNVRPELRNALNAYLRSDMSHTDDGVMFGGKSAEQFVKEFFVTDEGRAFLQPSVNSGGGAAGNTGSAPTTPDKWNFTTYAEMKSNGDLAGAAAYAKKHGKNF